MRKKIHLFLFAGLSLIAISLSACATTKVSETPIPVNFNAQAQHNVQSLTHLNIVAVDMADSILKKYNSGAGCIAGQNCDLSIFVNSPDAKTEYSEAFQNQFITTLVNRGMKVVRQSSAPVQVEIEMQFVPITGASIASYDAHEVDKGVWVVRDLNDTQVHDFKSLTATQGIIGDTNKNKWFYSSQIVPNTEMLITISFIKGGQYLARASNVYYVTSDIVPKKDAPQDKSVAKTNKMHVIGDCPGNRCIQ